jgi:hypothetical protein
LRWTVEIGFTTMDGSAGTLVRWPPELRHAVGQSFAPSSLGYCGEGFLGLKQCGDTRDSYLGFNVAGDGLNVAVGSGLDFSSFDDIVRPHPRSSGTRDWFPRFLAL